MRPQLASELDVTPNQLVLAWLLRQTDPTPIALTGPRTPAQFDSTMGALTIELSGEQLDRLDSAGV